MTTHVALLEALLFASGKPATVERLAEAAEISKEEAEAALDALEKACDADGRGVRLDRVAGGARLVSRNEFDVPVRNLLGLEGKNKLSIASLEVLSIVAYRQPVTAPEIAELRGVNSASSLRTLLDKKIITTAGRKEVVGTPFLYKTTKEFLVHFGLSDLKDLPRPEDLDALYGVETNTAQTELFPEQNATEEGRDEEKSKDKETEEDSSNG
jgi:segregation and condensation protein B